MGLYRANMNHAGLRLGQQVELDDSDPKVAKRVKAGALTRLDGPPPEVVEAPAAPKLPKSTAKAPAAKVAEESDVPEKAPVADEAEDEAVPEKPRAKTAKERRAEREAAAAAAKATPRTEEEALEAARVKAGLAAKPDEANSSEGVSDGDVRPTFSTQRASTATDPMRGARRS